MARTSFHSSISLDVCASEVGRACNRLSTRPKPPRRRQPSFLLGHCHTPEKTFVHVQAPLQVQMRHSVTTTLAAGELC